MTNDFFNHELDSDYHRSASAFLQQSVIKVIVEANDDLVLWQQLTNNALNSDKVKFDISAVYELSDSDSDGKGELLKLVDKCGEHFILAVDSDYEFVAHGHNERSNLINDNPFIFQTYCYALLLALMVITNKSSQTLKLMLINR